MNKLDIYVDETGDFGFNSKSSLLYGVSFVFHEEKDSIYKEAYIKSNNKVKEWQLRGKNFTEDNNLRGKYARKYVNNISGSKVESMINQKENYIDVTKEWLDNTEPNKGRVINRKYYIDKHGIKYAVDGKNVIFEPSYDEIKTAEFIQKRFGGNIYLNPKVNIPINVESSDYLWKNQLWDKKSIGKSATSLKRAVDNAIKEHKEQTDYIFLDITQSSIPKDNLVEQTKKIFSTKGREWVKGIMVIDGEEIKGIYIRKQKRG